MTPIASWSFKPFLHNRLQWLSTLDFMAVARASILSVYENYGTPTIYTDSLGEQIFSTIIDSSKVSIINVYDDIDIPNNLWAMSKFIALEKQKASYFHFDLDVVIKKPIQHNNADVVVHGRENIFENKTIEKQYERYYNLHRLAHLYRLPTILHNFDRTVLPFNTGILMMNNMDLHRVYLNTVLELYQNNIDLLRNRDLALDMCTIEQYTLALIANKLRSNVLCCIENSITNFPETEDFIHFVGVMKTNTTGTIQQKRNSIVVNNTTKEVIDMANLLNKLREKYSEQQSSKVN